MTIAQAKAKLAAETTENRLTDSEYAALVEAALPSHARRRWSTAYFRMRDPRYYDPVANRCGGMGVRRAVDAALRMCMAEAGEVYAVGNSQERRA